MDFPPRERPGPRRRVDLDPEFAPLREEMPREPRARRRLRRRRGNETLARVGWALPWIVAIVVAIAVGGLLFAAAMLAFSCLTMAELFKMGRDARPFDLVAFGVAAALIVAAYYGGQYQMVIIGAAAFPAMFLAALARDERGGVTTSFAFTPPRDRLDRGSLRPRGAAAPASVPRRGAAGRRPGRDVPHRHLRVLRRAHGGPSQARTADLAQQDRRGSRDRDHRRHPRVLVRRPLPGLADGYRRAGHRASASRSRPLSATSSSRSSSATSASRTRAASSARTAARSTASTPCSSPSSLATTSRRR